MALLCRESAGCQRRRKVTVSSLKDIIAAPHQTAPPPKKNNLKNNPQDKKKKTASLLVLLTTDKTGKTKCFAPADFASVSQSLLRHFLAIIMETSKLCHHSRSEVGHKFVLRLTPTQARSRNPERCIPFH